MYVECANLTLDFIGKVLCDIDTVAFGFSVNCRDAISFIITFHTILKFYMSTAITTNLHA